MFDSFANCPFFNNSCFDNCGFGGCNIGFDNCGFGGCNIGFDNCGFGGCNLGFDNCGFGCGKDKKVKKVKQEKKVDNDPCNPFCKPCYKPKCYNPCKKACDCKVCKKSYDTIYKKGY